MRFTKMHGIGNDYVYLDCTKEAPKDLPELARRMSNRHFGIGSDGLICIFPTETADFRMVMFNADGSEGAMCGNGIRCLGKYVFDKKLTSKTELTIETPAGLRSLALATLGSVVTAATVDMGVPEVGTPMEMKSAGQTFRGTPVSMGNPHFVCLADDPTLIDLEVVGPAMETDPRFPNRTNVEFVAVRGRDRLVIRVWERGSGETLACGTGACAALAALAARDLCDRAVRVTLPGGELSLRWAENGHIYMTGPAVTVFEGEWPEE